MATPALAAPPDGPLDSRLRRAGAVMVERDGRLVAARYGSVATEATVCDKRVGLAARSELEVLELAGRASRLERVLVKAAGDAVPLPGSAAHVADAWCARLAADRALVVAHARVAASWRRLARDCVVAGSPITVADPGLTVVSVLGPRASRLLTAAGLPSRLRAGELASGTLAGAPAVLVREDPTRFLLLLPEAAADAGWHALDEAGSDLELAYVGCEALERLAAAKH